MDLRHLQCCHFAVVFDTLTPHVEFQSIRGWIVPKLSEYVKVAEAAEILGVSLGTVRTWAADGKIPMHRNPANGYRLFRREELEKFLKKIAKPIISKKQSNNTE
jgi:excisionase family DNA binding protein